MSLVKSRARGVARHAALSLLAQASRQLGNQPRSLAEPRVHFVYLHSVRPHEEAGFERLVAALERTSQLISYSEAVRRVLEGPIDRPYICFSFDDGFASCMRAALILERHGVSGCFFVPSAFVGCESVAVARAFFRSEQGVDESALSWGELETLQARGHEVGSHTMNHLNLAEVSARQMEDEILGARAELLKRLGTCEHFAWPYGRFHHFSPAAASVTYAAGHSSCASAERGAHTQVVEGSDANLCIRRDHVMPNWPLQHSLYLISRSSAVSDLSVGAWPQRWELTA